MGALGHAVYRAPMDYVRLWLTSYRLQGIPNSEGVRFFRVVLVQSRFVVSKGRKDVEEWRSGGTEIRISIQRSWQ